MGFEGFVDMIDSQTRFTLHKREDNASRLCSLNHKMGGVSIISGTLSSVSGAFPTFAIQFIVSSLYGSYSKMSNLFR